MMPLKENMKLIKIMKSRPRESEFSEFLLKISNSDILFMNGKLQASNKVDLSPNI